MSDAAGGTSDGISENARRAVDEVNLSRGRLVASYASVEYFLGDLCEKCKQMPDYQEVSRRFPFNLDDRIRMLRRIAAMPGPLSQFEAEINECAEEISRHTRLRHFLVHGIGRATIRGQSYALELRMYERDEEGNWQTKFLETDRDAINLATDAVNEFGHRMYDFFKKVYADLGLERR